jgi:hypothetical protein
MICLHLSLAYAVFHELGKTLIDLKSGEFQELMEIAVGDQDKIDLINYCNDLSKAYNHMLAQFQEHPKYANQTKSVERFTHLFGHLY